MEEKVYFPELDGLRFFAFLAVFIHHGPVITSFPLMVILHSRGWAGVDLFLCLSAFLFVHLLNVEWQRTGRINVVKFYLRRALRIWPAYFFFLAVIILFTYATRGHSDARLLRFYGLLTFTDNILSALIAYNPISFVGQLWTISYEEQFYAVIPWFLLFVFPKVKKTQFCILGGVFLAGLLIRSAFILLKANHPAIWVLPITHFESVLLGLWIGLAGETRMLKRLPWWITGLFGLFSLYAITWFPNIQITGWGLMAVYPLVGLGSALLVYTALHVRGVRVMSWLKWPPLVYLGKISYGLYLYHLAGFYLTSLLFEQLAVYHIQFSDTNIQNTAVFFTGLGITIAIASLSYAVIEKPFLRMKSRFAIVQSRPA